MYESSVAMLDDEVKSLMAQYPKATRDDVVRAIVKFGPARCGVQSALASERSEPTVAAFTW